MPFDRLAGVRSRGDGVVVRFSEPVLGEMCVTQLAPALHDMAEREDCREIVLDFCHVERLSSAVLARIVRLQRKMDAQGRRLSLVNVGPRVHQILKVTKLDQILHVALSEANP
jgi:anti-anti-sigma factor